MPGRLPVNSGITHRLHSRYSYLEYTRRGFHRSTPPRLCPRPVTRAIPKSPGEAAFAIFSLSLFQRRSPVIPVFLVDFNLPEKYNWKFVLRIKLRNNSNANKPRNGWSLNPWQTSPETPVGLAMGSNSTVPWFVCIPIITYLDTQDKLPVAFLWKAQITQKNWNNSRSSKQTW